MRLANNLVGRRFGRLLVVIAASNPAGRLRWDCLCDCGTMHLVAPRDLVQARVKSCGCLRKDNCAKMGREKHGTAI